MARSITRRLTLLVAATAAVVFAVVGLLLYLALERELTRRETEELLGRLHFVTHLLTEVPDLATAEDLRHHLDDMLASHGNLSVWIGTTDRRRIYGEDPPIALPVDTNTPFTFVRSDGTPMRAIAERLAPTATKPAIDVFIAMDARPTHQVLVRFGFALGVLCVAGVAAMLVLGAWVARRGLQPVKALSDAAHAIGPHALSQRLGAHDIPAELVTLAQSFNRVLDRLEHAYRQLEAFNADVAHELRTPLLNLIGETEVALSRERATEELRDVLSSNLEELERVKLIVNDMLFLARADRGERANATSVALDQVVQDVAEFLEPVFAERGITLETEGRADVPGDVGLLRRALTNLLSNALAYTPSGGTIRIEITLEHDLARLSVRNPGPTIEPKHLPHIFDRFYRADAARSARPHGHGLGLAIVKAIMDMHRGAVFAASGDGMTEIGFRLPRPVSGMGSASKNDVGGIA